MRLSLPWVSPKSAWNSVRPVVTHSGGAYVHLGMIRADAVEQIAATLRVPTGH